MVNSAIWIRFHANAIRIHPTCQPIPPPLARGGNIDVTSVQKHGNYSCFLLHQ